MFPGDAAKQLNYYINNVLKKPQQVPVRYFFQQVEQLNGYLLYLSCTYDSPQTTAATKPVLAYDEVELANFLLCMCLESWQDQYNLNQELLPQSIRKLLVVLENIKKNISEFQCQGKGRKRKH